ncbi:MAG: hypothetical protein Q8O97_02125, partial [bacterium]|nr:hypothetical protein [bacterium]
MKYLFVIFAISFAVLLGAAQIVFAGHLAAACIDSGYNKAGGCQVGATYGDQGGSELQSCQYRVVSNGEQTVGWTNASEGTCSGSQAFLWTNPITISGTGNCNDEGVAKCLIYAKAIDNGGNETTNQIATLDIDYSLPVVSATNASSQWFTSRTTTLSVSDTGGSTLAQARYSWDTNTMNSSCTSGGTTFTNGAVLTVAQGSHRLYLCARDGAGNLTSPNPWDSGADQYRVDYTAPTYQAFTVNGVFCSGFSCPATVTTSSPLTITWSASDTGGSGIQKHEVWRSKDGEPWFLIQDNAISPFSNTPPSSGTWWYGVHSVDNTGNCIQDNGGHCGGVSSDSLDDRTARGPI